MKISVGIIILIALVASVAILLNGKKDEASTPLSVNQSFEFEQDEFDFGTVKQSGGIITHDFEFTYTGADTVTVTGIPTSCGCTSATINTPTLTTGSKGIVTVAFDPNLHAEPLGRFYKTVTLLTDPQIPNTPELKIWASIDLDLGEDAYKEGSHVGEVLLNTENLAPEKSYRTISAATLKEALEDKHFFMVDVHVPEQQHIDGTDAVIAYDKIADNLSELPEDKDETIALYCRSGSMSQQAAQALTDLGYTNVIHVEGGIQAFNQL
ncbi:DUF1573 domain-containing protein [Candidatus Uhrbacteria bacterium]|nr:DUF1573 domain-containing protein [Candidatus Uhrbacteria bacterium]